MIPPTLEQLNLGINSTTSLLLIRILSGVLILLSTLIISKTVKNNGRWFFLTLVLSSPVLMFICFSYPVDAFAIFLSTSVYFLIKRYSKNSSLPTIISIIIVITFNLMVAKQTPKILEDLSLTKSQSEVTFRFNIEDNLKPNIYIPLSLKRIVYNKFFVSLRNSLNDSLKFFDFETLFFQEVHPLNQKGFIIFFWPEVFIFTLSLYFIFYKKIKPSSDFLGLLVISFVYFITTNYSSDRRLAMSIFPLSMLMADSISFTFKKLKFTKFCMVIIFILTIYGFFTFYKDLNTNFDYWFDNRPIAYSFIFNSIKNSGHNYGQIIVPDTLYAAKKYCNFYIKNCPEIKILNFNIGKETLVNDTVYAGFTGNFMGENRQNANSDEIIMTVKNLGLNVISSKHVLNNIASGYGQELIVAEYKK